MNRAAERLWRFVSRGNAEGLPPEQRMKQSLLTLVALFIAVLAVFWGSLYLWLGYPLSGAIPLGYAAISFVSMGDYFLRRRFAFFRNSQLLLIFLLPFLLMWSLGGFANGSAVMIWALFTPLAAVYFADMTVARRWLLAYLAMVVISVVLDPYLQAWAAPMAPLANTLFFALNLGLGSAGIFLALFYFVRESEAMRRDLETTNEELAEAYTELKRSAARIRELMMRDPLTGVFNRRALSERLEEELERARRHDQPLALLMLDIDHFKTINDRFGHQMGDRVLVELGRCLRRQVRRIDFVARYGGEEFVILLPQTDLGGACRFAERLRRDIGALTVEGLAEPLSVSIGVTARQARDTADDLLKRADDALYAAKRAGRNRVIGG